jgi:hypothetical protein
MKKSLLFLFLVLAFSQVKSQHTITLNVDSFFQPFQVLGFADFDTLRIIAKTGPIYNNLRPLDLSESEFVIGNPQIDFYPCNPSFPDSMINCNFWTNDVVFDTIAIYTYYDIPDCRNVLIHHQGVFFFYLLFKSKNCELDVNTPDADMRPFDFYPNPSDGRLNIKTNHKGKYVLKVYNSIGKVVYQGQLTEHDTSLDLSTEKLPSGIYFLECLNTANQRLSLEKWIVYH